MAREAGVSPAAPYHHFKDKGELLDAVAARGLGDAGRRRIAKAKAARPVGPSAMTEIGVAYVCFARDNPALYRVMYDTARDQEALPEQMQHDERQRLLQGAATPWSRPAPTRATPLDLELATIAAWCSAHGLAEMAGFKQFDHLKAGLRRRDGLPARRSSSTWVWSAHGR